MEFTRRKSSKKLSLMFKILLFLLPIVLSAANLKFIIENSQNSEPARIKAYEASRAKLERESVASSYLPSLSLEGGMYRTYGDRSMLTPKSSSSILAKVEFLLYDGGAREARDEILSHLQNKAVLEDEEFRNYLAYQSANLYFNAVALEKIIAAKHAQSRYLNSALKRLVKMQSAGLAATDELESIRARYHLSLSEALEFKQKQNEILSSIELISAQAIIPQGGAYLQMPNFSKSPENLNLKALNEQLLASEHRVQEVGSKQLPQIFIYDTYGFYRNDYNFALGEFERYRPYVNEFFEKNSQSNQLGVGFKWKIFDFKATSKEKQSARIASLQARLNLDYKRRENELKLKNLKNDIEVLTSKISALEQYVKAADASLEASVKKYESGLLGYTEFLAALAAKFDAVSALEMSVDELEIKKAEYFYESGVDIAQKVVQ